MDLSSIIGLVVGTVLVIVVGIGPAKIGNFVHFVGLFFQRKKTVLPGQLRHLHEKVDQFSHIIEMKKSFCISRL